MLHHLHLPAKRLLDPCDEAAFVVATISLDELESRKALLEGHEQELATMVILDVGLMNQNMQDWPICIDEQVPLAPLDFLPAVIASQPPF
jgi:hypothetical protein